VFTNARDCNASHNQPTKTGKIMNSVINTYERAIERFTADRVSANQTLSDLTTRCENLKAEIVGLDSSLSAHYEALGRIHYEAARAE
jgi:hypothetical protein